MNYALSGVWSLKDGLVRVSATVARKQRRADTRVRWETQSEPGTPSEWDATSVASEPIAGRWAGRKRKRACESVYDGEDTVSECAFDAHYREQEEEEEEEAHARMDQYCVLGEVLACQDARTLVPSSPQCVPSSAPMPKTLDFTGRRPLFHLRSKRRNKP